MCVTIDASTFYIRSIGTFFFLLELDTIYCVISTVQCNMLLKYMIKPRTNPIVSIYIKLNYKFSTMS